VSFNTERSGQRDHWIPGELRQDDRRAEPEVQVARVETIAGGDVEVRPSMEMLPPLKMLKTSRLRSCPGGQSVQL
jgi:hypothetical protein